MFLYKVLPNKPLMEFKRVHLLLGFDEFENFFYIMFDFVPAAAVFSGEFQRANTHQKVIPGKLFISIIKFILAISVYMEGFACKLFGYFFDSEVYCTR